MVGKRPPQLANMYALGSQNTNIKWYIRTQSNRICCFQTPDAVFPEHIFLDYLSTSLTGHPRHIGQVSINLLTLFQDRLIPWRSPELTAHTYTFASNLQLPFLESTEGRKKEIISWSLSTKAMWPGWGSNSWPQYMTDKESAKHPTALLDPSWGSNSWPFHYR